MKKFAKLMILVLMLCIMTVFFVACDNEKEPPEVDTTEYAGVYVLDTEHTIAPEGVVYFTAFIELKADGTLYSYVSGEMLHGIDEFESEGTWAKESKGLLVLTVDGEAHTVACDGLTILVEDGDNMLIFVKKNTRPVTDVIEGIAGTYAPEGDAIINELELNEDGTASVKLPIATISAYWSSVGTKVYVTYYGQVIEFVYDVELQTLTSAYGGTEFVLYRKVVLMSVWDFLGVDYERLVNDVWAELRDVEFEFVVTETNMEDLTGGVGLRYIGFDNGIICVALNDVVYLVKLSDTGVEILEYDVESEEHEILIALTYEQIYSLFLSRYENLGEGYFEELESELEELDDLLDGLEDALPLPGLNDMEIQDGVVSFKKDYIFSVINAVCNYFEIEIPAEVKAVWDESEVALSIELNEEGNVIGIDFAFDYTETKYAHFYYTNGGAEIEAGLDIYWADVIDADAEEYDVIFGAFADLYIINTEEEASLSFNAGYFDDDNLSEFGFCIQKNFEYEEGVADSVLFYTNLYAMHMINHGSYSEYHSLGAAFSIANNSDGIVEDVISFVYYTGYEPLTEEDIELPDPFEFSLAVIVTPIMVAEGYYVEANVAYNGEEYYLSGEFRMSAISMSNYIDASLIDAEVLQ
ncbi:MAG: hypothetical protein PHX51_05995 [Clostridia bacterium]|nr:hypothetical protein [Clostridia bacterium]